MRIEGIDVRDPEEGRFFLVRVEPQDRAQFYELLSEPGRTNRSREAMLEGWLGSTNNTSRHACGAVEIYRDTAKRLRCRRIDAQELWDEDDTEIERGPGQPPRAGEAATARLEVRVTDAEKARIRELATEAGLDVSDYVRGRVL